MNQVKEALKAAITALEYHHLYTKQDKDAHKLCKSALSEIERCEPVAWVLDHTPNKGYMKVTHVKEYADKEMSRTKESNPSGFGKEYGCYPYDVCIPLYTSPINKEWLSLSDKGIEDLAKQNKYWYGFNSDRFDWRAYSSDLIYELKKLNAVEKG